MITNQDYYSLIYNLGYGIKIENDYEDFSKDKEIILLKHNIIMIQTN